MCMRCACTRNFEDRALQQFSEPDPLTFAKNRQLAWRQHDGGHTDGPNWKYFIPWADKNLTPKK